MIAGNYAIFSYDSALDTGNGGLHVTGQIPITELLDSIAGATSQGVMLYRGPTLWTALQPGTTSQVLLGGTTPSWSSISTVLDVALGSSIGNIGYRTSLGWVGLPIAPTSGWVLKSTGTLPTWAAP